MSPPLQQTLSRRGRGTKKRFSVRYTRGPLYNKYSALRRRCRLCGQTWKPDFCFSNKSFELIRKLMLNPNRWRWPLPLFVGFQGFDPDESPVGGGCPFKLGTRPQTSVKGQRTQSEFLQECFMVPFNQRRRCRPLEAGRSPTPRKFILPSHCHQFNPSVLNFNSHFFLKADNQTGPVENQPAEAKPPAHWFVMRSDEMWGRDNDGRFTQKPGGARE